MAGHSQWANIKHRKARQDAVKGKAWSRCSKAIIVAAKAGGGDPATNLALRYAIDDAKAENMPKDTIAKAIKKGTGELDGGADYHAVRFEGYGPGGVALIVDCLTDNQNRTAPEIRKIFERANGNLGVPGSVSFSFAQRGLIIYEKEKISEDDLMLLAIDAGAEDVRLNDDVWEVTTDPKDFMKVKQALIEAGHEPDSASITMIPQNTVKCAGDDAERIMRLIENLEEHDDVQNVYANYEISEEDMARLGT